MGSGTCGMLRHGQGRPWRSWGIDISIFCCREQVVTAPRLPPPAEQSHPGQRWLHSQQLPSLLLGGTARRRFWGSRRKLSAAQGDEAAARMASCGKRLHTSKAPVPLSSRVSMSPEAVPVPQDMRTCHPQSHLCPQALGAEMLGPKTALPQKAAM